MSNAAYDKSFRFAIKIVNLYKYLCEEKKEYIISKQVLRLVQVLGRILKKVFMGIEKEIFYLK